MGPRRVSGLVDIHAHVLPGVDDGAGSLDEAIAMCAVARGDGISAIVATPHQRHELWPDPDPAELESARSGLAAATQDVPALHLGAEIRADSGLIEAVAGMPHNGLLSLAGSRYLLIELPSLTETQDTRALVYELRVAGWEVILAHPERVPWLAGAPELLAALVDCGALLQVTAGSLIGEFGRGPMLCCEWLLDRGLVHFVASDAHDALVRPPLLSAAFHAVARRWNEECAVALMQTNPLAVLDNRSVEGRLTK